MGAIRVLSWVSGGVLLGATIPPDVKFIFEMGGAGAFCGGVIGWLLSTRFPAVRVDRIAGWAGTAGAATAVVLLIAGA